MSMYNLRDKTTLQSDLAPLQPYWSGVWNRSLEQDTTLVRAKAKVWGTTFVCGLKMSAMGSHSLRKKKAVPAQKKLEGTDRTAQYALAKMAI